MLDIFIHSFFLESRSIQKCQQVLCWAMEFCLSLLSGFFLPFVGLLITLTVHNTHQRRKANCGPLLFQYSSGVVAPSYILRPMNTRKTILEEFQLVSVILAFFPLQSQLNMSRHIYNQVFTYSSLVIYKISPILL